MFKVIAQALGALLLISAATPASAWHRGHTEIFAVLPELSGGPVPSEGLTVGPDGTVYTPSLRHQQPGRGPWAAASVLLQPRRASALQCCSDQSRDSPAEHAPSRPGVSELFTDIADLRPLQRHCLAS